MGKISQERFNKVEDDLAIVKGNLRRTETDYKTMYSNLVVQLGSFRQRYEESERHNINVRAKSNKWLENATNAIVELNKRETPVFVELEQPEGIRKDGRPDKRYKDNKDFALNALRK